MKKKHVLIVEDYMASALTFTIFLSKLNITSDIATTGTDALEAVRNHEYDMILMDMGLPDLGGIKVTQEIRKLDDQRKSQVSIIGHSCSFGFYAPEIKKLGLYHFFIKPIGFSIFKNILLKCTK